jgi:hypothetical protein
LESSVNIINNDSGRRGLENYKQRALCLQV